MLPVVYAVLLMPLAVPAAFAHPCDPGYPNACVSPLATIDAAAIILPGADIDDFAYVGPNVEVGNAALGVRSSLQGRVSGASVQSFGDNSVLGRGSSVGADADIADDAVFARDVVVGSGLVARSQATIGYASMLEDDVTLEVGGTVGNLVTVGDRSTIGGVVSRGAVVGEEVSVGGIVGPNVSVGDGARVDGRVLRNAVIGAEAEVDAGARVGRGASVGRGAVLGDHVDIGAHGTVPDCAWLPGPERVFRSQTWSGTLFVPGCSVSASVLGVFELPSNEFLRVMDTQYDSAGNLFVAAYFRGDAQYDGTLLASSTPGKNAALIIKFDRQMNLVWSHSYAGTDHVLVYGLSVSGNDVYIAGDFQGTLTSAGTTLTSTSSSGWLVGKLSADTGSAQWTRAGQSTVGGIAEKVVADAQGVTVAGRYSGGMDFGLGVVLPSIGSSDLDVAVTRYNSLGEPQWVSRTGLTGGDTPGGLASMQNGDVAVTTLLFGASKTGANDFSPGLADCVQGCVAVSVIDSQGGEVATHQLISSLGNTLGGSVAVENGRLFVSANTSDGVLMFAGQSLALASHIFEFDSNAVPVQAWSSATTGGTSALNSLAVVGGVLYASVATTGTVSFGSASISHSNNAQSSDATLGLTALDVNGGGWQWARSPTFAGPNASGPYSGRNRSLSAYDDNGSVELTYGIWGFGFDTLVFSGAGTAINNLNPGLLIRTSAGPTWGF